MFSIRHKSAVRLVHVSMHTYRQPYPLPPPCIFQHQIIRVSSLWYTCTCTGYQCTYSILYEYNIWPIICFKIIYILHNNTFWLQMLLCMPEPFVCDYRPLVSEPKLMLEQLLMNMKVWGVPVVQKTSMACLFSFKQIRVGIYLFSDSLNYFFFCKSTKID